MVPAAVAAVAVAVGLALLWVYIPARERALQVRSYEALGTDAFQARVQAMREALATRGRGSCGTTAWPAGEDLCGLPGLSSLSADERKLRGVCPDQSSAELDPAAASLSVRSDGGDGHVYFAYLHDANRLCGKLDLKGLLPRSDLFDAVVLARSDGTILHKEGMPAAAFARLGSLAAGGEASGTEPSASDGEAAWRAALSRGYPVRVIGSEHLLFCQEIAGLEARIGEQATPSGLVICGLRERDRFRAEARRMPPLWLAVLASLVLFATLSWPFLKLRFLGPRERLTGFDVRLLVTCCLAGAGVATALLLAVRHQIALERGFDEQLGDISRQVWSTLREELRGARSQLQIARPGIAASSENLAAVRSSRPLEMLWITRYQASGEPFPMSRWQPSARDGVCSLERTEPPLVNVADLPFFARAQTGRPAFGILRSRYTSGMHAVVALPFQPSDRSAGVVTLSMPMRALLKPVMPAGTGFALVDRRGDVLAHAIPDRTLVENLVAAAGNDRRLKAAVWSRMPAWVDADYVGSPHRFRVVPLPQTATGDPMSLVVFREHLVAHTLFSDGLWTWLTLFVVYLVVLVLLLLVVRLAVVEPVPGGYRAAWLWPDRSAGMPFRYLRGAALLGATGVVGFRLLAGQTGVAAIVLLWLLPVEAVALLRLEIVPRRAGGDRGTRVAACLALAGALATVVLLASERDWWEAVAALLLAAIWWGRRAWITAARPARDPIAVAASLILAALLAALGHAPSALAVAATALVWWPGVLGIDAGRPGNPGRVETRFRAASVVMYVALLGVLAVVPSALLFEDARREVWSRFARIEQVAFDDARQQRNASLAEAAGCARPAARIGDVRDLYQPAWVADGPYARYAGPPPARRFTGWVATHLPAYSDLAARLRMIGSAGEEPSWPRPDHTTAGDAIGVGMVVALVVALFWWMLRRLFLLDADPLGHSDLPAAGRRGLWVLAHPGTSPPDPFESAADDTRFDLRRSATLGALDEAVRGVQPVRGVVRIEHLDRRLGEPVWERQVISLLESQVAHPDRSVVITSEIDPISHLSACVRDHRVEDGTAPSEAAACAKRLEQWSRVLESFAVNRHDAAFAASDACDGPDGQPDDTADDGLQARHWGIWRRCSHAEKLALRQLAEEGFLSPASVDVVHELMRRGLVRREPALALMTPSFRRFVLRGDSPEAVVAWEGEVGPSGWALLRVPLTAGLTLGGLVLVVTQPELLQSTASAVTALAAAVPILLRLLGLVGRESPNAATKA